MSDADRCQTCGSLMGERPHNCMPTVTYGALREMRERAEKAEQERDRLACNFIACVNRQNGWLHMGQVCPVVCDNSDCRRQASDLMMCKKAKELLA